MPVQANTSNPIIIFTYPILSDDEAKIMRTVVQLKSKQIKDVALPFESIYMLNMDDKLTLAKLHEILATGHSRIPCYRGTNRHNIQAVLFTKRLIVVRPEDEDPVSKYADLKPVWAKPQTDIFSILDEFQQGRSHIAIVSEDLHDVAIKYHAGADLDPSTKVLGMVTFEDIIEAMLSAEISQEESSTLTKTGSNSGLTSSSSSSSLSSNDSSTNLSGLTRGKKARRIVDPQNAKPSTLNEVLGGLTILAEQKGYIRSPDPHGGKEQPTIVRQLPKIPLKRSSTISAFRSSSSDNKHNGIAGGHKPNSSSAPKHGHHFSRGRHSRPIPTQRNGTSTATVNDNNASRNKSRTVRWQAADNNPYYRMDDVTEEDARTAEDSGDDSVNINITPTYDSYEDVPPSMDVDASRITAARGHRAQRYQHTPSENANGIVVSSAEHSNTHSPFGNRSRSEAIPVSNYAAQRATLIYTPSNHQRRAFNFSPSSDVPTTTISTSLSSTTFVSQGPVLVEEQLESGAVRVTIAPDRDSAVSTIEALNREADQEAAMVFQQLAEKEKLGSQEKETTKLTAATDKFSTFADKILSAATGSRNNSFTNLSSLSNTSPSNPSPVVHDDARKERHDADSVVVPVPITEPQIK